MNFVTLNKQESAIKSPDKKSESPGGSPIFLSRLLWSLVKSDKILCEGETRRSHSSTLQHPLTVFFFCKVNKNSAQCDRPHGHFDFDQVATDLNINLVTVRMSMYSFICNPLHCSRSLSCNELDRKTQINDKIVWQWSGILCSGTE